VGKCRENRPRSRHCDRPIAVSQATLPSCSDRVCFVRENTVRNGPRFARGFFIGILADSRQGRFVSEASSNFWKWLVAICALLLLFGGPEFAAQASSESSATPGLHEVIDGYGRTVRIPVNPTRIISLAPSLTETVYALDAEDRLVGDTDYCDYPPDAQKKPKVGGVVNPNLEAIAALHPDLVLLSKEGNQLDTVRALDTLGIPNYATDAHSIAEIIASTEKLAEVLNVPAKGKALGDKLAQELATLQNKLNGVPPRKVLFVVWPEPLISVGKNTFVGDALRRAGAVSIIDSNQDWPQVSLEEVARLQPEYLVFAAAHSGPAGSEFEAMANRPGFEILEAVRNRRYAVVSDAIIRPAPRIVSVIEDLARQLHPEVFLEKPATPKAPPTTIPLPGPFQTKPAVSHSAQDYRAEMTCAR